MIYLHFVFAESLPQNEAVTCYLIQALAASLELPFVDNDATLCKSFLFFYFYCESFNFVQLSLLFFFYCFPASLNDLLQDSTQEHPVWPEETCRSGSSHEEFIIFL